MVRWMCGAPGGVSVEHTLRTAAEEADGSLSARGGVLASAWGWRIFFVGEMAKNRI